MAIFRLWALSAAQEAKGRTRKGQPHAGHGQHAGSSTGSSGFFLEDVVVEPSPDIRGCVFVVPNP